MLTIGQCQLVPRVQRVQGVVGRMTVGNKKVNKTKVKKLQYSNKENLPKNDDALVDEAEVQYPWLIRPWESKQVYVPGG